MPNDLVLKFNGEIAETVTRHPRPMLAEGHCARYVEGRKKKEEVGRRQKPRMNRARE
jgi:hypothetical protein